MAIRDLLARWGTKASIVGLPATEQPDKALERTFDDAALLSTYRDDAWPYILANKIGEQASQAPLRLGTPGKDPGEFKFVDSHPVQALFDAPNPMTDGGDFIHLLMLYMELVGHAPIEVVRTKGGKPAELWLHNPGPWRIVPRTDGSIMGYLYLQESQQDVAWKPTQMTYTRWPDPNNRWYGQGRLAAVRQEVMAEEYASIRDKKLEKNLGIPPGILTSELPIGETTATELQKRWAQLVGGYQNAGKIGILGSKTTYQPIQLNAVDADWYKARGWRVETLAAAFGVPMPLIRMEGATFSNAEQARSEFWEGTLQPRLNRIARMLTMRLLPLLGVQGMVLRFDYSQIEALGENDLQAAQTATAWATTGAVIVDEVRARLGLPPHKDKAVGARLLVPSSITLKSEEDITAPPEPPTLPGAPKPPPAKARKAERNRETALAPVRDSWASDLRGYFQAVSNAVRSEVKHTKDALHDDPEFLLRVEQAIAAAKFRERLKRISQQPIGSSLTLGAADAADLLGIAGTFDLEASESAIRLLTGHLDRLGVQIANTTNAEVKAILEAALREGWTNDETRTKLADLFNDYADWRVDRITRTETTAAYNLGSVAQYRDAGIKLVRVVDGDGDEPCAAANGSLWTLEEAEGNPLGHPNCTRAWIPDTEGL